jgi:diguanylate cyclase (GGDEF)-like protein/PAS domain S-box-containing protein
MTEVADLDTIAECFRSGAVDVVGKPTLHRLGRAVLGALSLRHAREARARTETSLRDSEASFRLLTDTLPGVVYLQRLDGRPSMVYINQMVETLTGYSREAFLSQAIGFSELRHPADRAVCDQAIDLAVAARRPFRLVYRLRHQSGSWRWVEEHGVVHGVGEHIQVQGFLSDITERRRRERRSQRQRWLTRATFASIGDAMITADGNGRIDAMNPVAERLTGWPAAEAKGLLLTDLVRALGNGHNAADAVAINRNGMELAIAGTAAPVLDRKGKQAGAVVVFHDATVAREASRQLSYDATHDALTGLINRAEFERRLERAVRGAQQDLAHHTLCYLDLDHFKQVNDGDGHSAGDAVLRQLARDLGAAMRTRDTLSRLGGDEFGLLLEHCNQTRALEVAANLLRVVGESHFRWKDQTVSIGISIGVAPISSDSESPAAVLRNADAACYAAKRRGGNCVQLFRDPASSPSTSGPTGELVLRS